MAEDPLGSQWKTLDRDLNRISQLEMATNYVARPMVGLGIAFAFILMAFLIAMIWFGGTEGSLIVAAAAAVGAYMAGLIIKKEYFDFHPERKVDFHQQALEMINNIAYSWIGPVFFVTLGSKLIFDSELAITVLPYSLTLFVCLFVAQILSAGLAARFTGNFDWASSWMIGFGMLGRAELAFVVMDIAFIEHQIFTMETFYTLMLTAFLLNICVPLTIRWWKPRMPAT